MTLAIILTAIICGTVAFIVLVTTTRNRDAAAQSCDYGLGKVYSARASLMHVEEMERRRALYQKSKEERNED